MIDASVANWSLELSPESHDEEIRCLQDETTAYSKLGDGGGDSGCAAAALPAVDVFFMIGLPRQTQGIGGGDDPLLRASLPKLR